jgi:phosphoribosylanthranilate isomerase
VIVKICGIRSLDAARAASDAGADLLGFNFAPISRRLVGLDAAREAIDGCRAAGAGRHVPRMVGIFVNQPLANVSATARDAGLDFIQLSGHETPDFCRAVVDATGLPVIKAVQVHDAASLAVAERYVRDGMVTGLLADAPVAGSYGGSGQAWSWADAAGLAARHTVLLAGGLTPENVAEAARQVRPWGVDVASGVETNGQTNPERVAAFIQQARTYEHSHTDN